jgi:hypothetical protein
LVEVIGTGDIDVVPDTDFRSLGHPVIAEEHDRDPGIELRMFADPVCSGNDVFGRPFQVHEDQVRRFPLRRLDGAQF